MKQTETARKPVKSRAAGWRRNLWLDTMVLPGAIWLLLIRYLPMFGIVLAFKNYNAQRPNTFWNNILKSKWVGLDNFQFLKSPDTAIMIRNTLGYNLLWIALGLVIAVAGGTLIEKLRLENEIEDFIRNGKAIDLPQEELPEIL